jgi:hypothetical protein
MIMELGSWRVWSMNRGCLLLLGTWSHLRYVCWSMLAHLFYLTCNTYLYFETDYSLISLLFHCDDNTDNICWLTVFGFKFFQLLISTKLAFISICPKDRTYYVMVLSVRLSIRASVVIYSFPGVFWGHLYTAIGLKLGVLLCYWIHFASVKPLNLRNIFQFDSTCIIDFFFDIFAALYWNCFIVL